MSLSAHHYYRISGIPTDWTEVGITGGLNSLEPTIVHDDQHLHLSLYPACSGLTQTGILKLNDCLELFKQVESDDINLEISVEGESANVGIDCHFYNLTPLNIPGNHIAE
jgi:hypothetical protein